MINQANNGVDNMKVDTFLVERWMNKYENGYTNSGVEYNEHPDH